jgi:hypothetical protein
VAPALDGDHSVESEVPDRLRVEERHDDAAGGGIHVHGKETPLCAWWVSRAALISCTGSKVPSIDGVRDVPQVSQHPHTAGLDIRSLGTLVLVDHVLVDVAA